MHEWQFNWLQGVTLDELEITIVPFEIFKQSWYRDREGVPFVACLKKVRYVLNHRWVCLIFQQRSVTKEEHKVLIVDCERVNVWVFLTHSFIDELACLKHWLSLRTKRCISCFVEYLYCLLLQHREALHRLSFLELFETREEANRVRVAEWLWNFSHSLFCIDHGIILRVRVDLIQY